MIQHVKLGTRTGMGLIPDEPLNFGVAIGGIRLKDAFILMKVFQVPAINAPHNCKNSLPEDHYRKYMRRENGVVESKGLLSFRPK